MSSTPTGDQCRDDKRHRNIPPPYQDENFWHNSIADRVPNSLKFGYEFVCLAAGATIIVIVADVTTFAQNCGLSDTVSSYAFVAQGVGTIISGIATSWLQTHYHGNHIIAGISIVGCLFSITIPFVTSVILLFTYYFVLGFVSNTLFTVTFYMMRATLAHHAGPWMALGQVFYGIGGVLLTSIDVLVFYTVTSCWICTIAQYICLSLTYVFMIVYFYSIARDPQENPSLMIEEHELTNNRDIVNDDAKDKAIEIEALRRREEQQQLADSDPDMDPFPSDYITIEMSNNPIHRHLVTQDIMKHIEESVPHMEAVPNAEESVPHYYVEIVLCVIMVLIIGGLFTVMAYLTTYAEERGLESYNAGYAEVTIGYVCSVIAIIPGFLDQAYYITCQQDIRNRLYLFALLGGGVMVFPILFPDSLIVLWLSTSLYMTLNGPMYGYLYDWMNRLTYTTETGTAILTMGMNAGAAIVIVFVMWVWSFVGSITLMYCGLLTMWLTVPFIWLAERVSYRKDIQGKAVTQDQRGNHQPIPNHDMPLSDDL